MSESTASASPEADASQSLARDFIVCVDPDGPSSLPEAQATKMDAWLRGLAPAREPTVVRRGHITLIHTGGTRIVGEDGPETRPVICCLVGAPQFRGRFGLETVERALAQAYAQEGPGVVAEIDGFCCGVLIDEARERALVFTDRFGFQKAFLTQRHRRWWAASRAVLLGRALDLPPDQIGIASSLLAGWTLGNRTLFEGCEALSPGTAVAIDRAGVFRHEYFRIGDHLASGELDPERLEELRGLFNQAVSRMTAHQPRIALNLTGGFDTRMILSAALHCGKEIVSITNGVHELPFVDPIRRFVPTQHHTFGIEGGATDDRWRDPTARVAAYAALTDGELDCLLGSKGIAYWPVIGRLAPGGVLHGALGEAWRSFYYASAIPPLAWIRLDPVRFLVWRLTVGRRSLVGLLSPTLRRRWSDMVRSEVERIWLQVRETRDPLGALDGFYVLERQRALNRVVSCAGRWMPNLIPFCERDFVSRALGYVGRPGRSETLHRHIVSRNAPALADLPTTSSPHCHPLRAWQSLGRPYDAFLRKVSERLAPQRPRPTPSTRPQEPPLRLEFLRTSPWATAAAYDMEPLRRHLTTPQGRIAVGNGSGVGSLIAAELLFRSEPEILRSH